MPLTSPLTKAQQITQQDTTLVHNILTQIQKRVSDGIPAVAARAAIGTVPAQAEVPAVSAADYQAALGVDLEIFQALFATAL